MNGQRKRIVRQTKETIKGAYLLWAFFATGVTNHWTEVDWTGLDWTHKNVRNKLINHRKQNLSTRKIEHDGT